MAFRMSRSACPTNWTACSRIVNIAFPTLRIAAIMLRTKS